MAQQKVDIDYFITTNKTLTDHYPHHIDKWCTYLNKNGWNMKIALKKMKIQDLDQLPDCNMGQRRVLFQEIKSFVRNRFTYDCMDNNQSFCSSIRQVYIYNAFFFSKYTHNQHQINTG